MYELNLWFIGHFINHFTLKDSNRWCRYYYDAEFHHIYIILIGWCYFPIKSVKTTPLTASSFEFNHWFYFKVWHSSFAIINRKIIYFKRFNHAVKFLHSSFPSSTKAILSVVLTVII